MSPEGALFNPAPAFPSGGPTYDCTGYVNLTRPGSPPAAFPYSKRGILRDCRLSDAAKYDGTSCKTAALMENKKAERLPTLGSREEIEGGVESLPALRAPVMTAAIIRNSCLFY
jgi:hypothetical protein